MIYLDITIFFGGWIFGQVLFRGYEAHVSRAKRAAKLGFLSTLFGVIYYVAGRTVFIGALLAMFVAMAILHGYWFHFRHGVHWRTAEPRERYWQLIGYRDGSKDS